MTNDLNAAERPGNGRLTSAERTRRALIRAALQLFGTKGFDGTSTREIAAAADANIGSIAYHFGGKAGLRDACAAFIVETIGQVAGAALRMDLPDEASATTPQEAEQLLTQAVEAMVTFIVARPESGEMVQFILRELSHPTSALDTIYAGVFEPVHKRLCKVWEQATGDPADSDRTKITVFTLLGQVVYFRIGREAVRRRMGWSEIGNREAAVVVEAAVGNLRAILAAHRSSAS